MILSIIIFIILLQILVFVHEFGHFQAARKSGVAVEEFGFGLPPRIVGFLRKGVLYSINWLPLGGFVRLKGEQGNQNDDDSFSASAWHTRLLILCSGVMMNVLFAVIALTIAFMIGYPTSFSERSIYPDKYIHNRALLITEVLPNSPALSAGLKVGDKITQLNNQPIRNLQTAQQVIKDGKQISLRVISSKREQSILMTPTIIDPLTTPAIGVALEDVGDIRLPFLEAIGRGMIQTFQLGARIMQALFGMIHDLWKYQRVSPDIGGPVAIAVFTNKVVDLGFSYLLQFAAVISLNFAIINFLPFPALDGGRVLFLVIEKLRGKAVSQVIEQWAHQVGFVILIVLALLITLRDISRFELLDVIKRLL